MLASGKVVVANAAGKTDSGRWIIHFPSRWSYTMDARTVKYTFYPYELAYLSSLLKRDTAHRVRFMDGNLRGWDADEYIRRMAEERPDYLVMETATVTYPIDLRIGLEMKRRFGTKLIFTGQHATAVPDRLLADGVDHVCIGEFEYTVRDLLRGADPATLRGLHPNGYGDLVDVNDLPFPEDDDVPRVDYTEPPIECCDYNDFEVFASRGCPLSCTFCVSGGGNTYYAKKNWRTRDVSNIIAELRYLRGRYPRMRGVFFDEEMHNVKKSFVLELCEAIRDAGLSDIRYKAMCGYWSLDEEQLHAMRAAGYYKLRVGIESVSPETLAGIKKKIDHDRLYQVLVWARQADLRMYGTFMFGAPGSTRESDERTVATIREYARQGLLYDLQIAMSTPQPGTPFYQQAQAEGWLRTDEMSAFDGAHSSPLSYPHYSGDEIEAVYRKAHDVAEDILIRRRLKDRGFVPALARSVRLRGPAETMRIGGSFLARQGAELLRRLRTEG